MFIILQTSYIIIIHHHTRFSSSLSSILWIQASRQSSPVESLSGSQSSPALLSGQDSPALSSPYLGLKVVHPYQALNCSRTVPDVYIRQVRSFRVTPRDLCHLAWHAGVRPSSSRITRPTSTQERRSGYVQPIGHSLSLDDAQG